MAAEYASLVNNKEEINMKWIIVCDIIDNAGNLVDDTIVLRVSDDNFNKAVTFTKEAIADAKWQGKIDSIQEEFVWNLDTVITDMLDTKGIKYERHTEIPKRTPEELDEAMDEYWIFYDQLDEYGEQ